MADQSSEWEEVREKQKTLWDECQRQLDKAETEINDKRRIALASARVCINLISDLQDDLEKME